MLVRSAVHGGELAAAELPTEGEYKQYNDMTICVP